jgi:hypothetical protein
VVQLVADFGLNNCKNSVGNISELVQKQALANPPSIVLMQGTMAEKNVTIGAFIAQKL